jgi:hypothetical protein
MSDDVVRREVLAGGAVRLTAGDCAFHYRRPAPGALLVTISGLDAGQFGTTTLDEIATAIAREGRLELFVDAREALGATVGVSDDWTRFFSNHRDRLARVHVLAGSKVVELTVAMAQHLSRTGNLIQIYSDPEIFASRLAVAAGR